MTIEQRRSKRTDDFLPIEIRVVHELDGRELAGPFSGRIIDISKHGACLFMSQIMVHAFHVFYSTRETDHAVLQLIIDLQPDGGRHVLTARPVWMSTFRQNAIRAFKMGVDFIEDSGALQMRILRAALYKHQKTRGAWWRQHSRV